MDLRNWEFNTLGSAVSGADVYVYDASLTHPNAGSILSSTTTNSDGMWAFTGLTNTAKDVRVVYQGKTKWYKGLTRHSVGVMFIDDQETTDYLQLVGQSSVSAPGASTVLGRVYMKTSGKRFGRYENGSEYQIADFAGATGVLRSGGWGTIQTADIADSQVTTAKIADLNVTTGKLAANSVTQSGYVEGSTSGPTTTSSSYADLAEMSVTLTTTGGDLLVDFDAGAYASTGGLTATFAISLDGASEVHIRDYNLGSSAVTPLSLHHRFTSVSAASHTVKIRWKTSGGTITAFGTQRSLRVVELKK